MSVEQARHDQRYDLAFWLRQRFVAPPQLGQLCTLLSHHEIPISRLLNRVEELLVTNGLS